MSNYHMTKILSRGRQTVNWHISALQLFHNMTHQGKKSLEENKTMVVGFLYEILSNLYIFLSTFHIFSFQNQHTALMYIT